ncbi:gliding motility protein RemB [Lacinutrix venerupis]|uniref:Gliding motility protein RemB n=1 Tax=Lacinutrix venerupis TaxID=1486034 RepID=A0AAC9LL04_9FLAO|nr:gliding motility protein RemB [Lacinutrix venerupis]APX99336.1 gliding motility protein RemB [Lacinutrix venerupis]
MRFYTFILILCFQSFSYAQDFNEIPPVFDSCKDEPLTSLQKCFDNQVFNLLFANFKVPKSISDSNYKGEVVILFEVDKEGGFRVMYIDAVYPELKTEATRVISEFPKVEPAKYNGNATYKQYSITLKIPLENQTVVTEDLALQNKETEVLELNALEIAAKNEIDKINANYKKYDYSEYSSQLNIPFSHENYAKFDRATNLIGTNSHTASKPFIYEDVATYHDFKAENDALLKDKKTWAGKKLWNEHLVQLQGKDYWFTVDPIFDLQLGKDTDADFSYTYNNTRGVYIQGGLGKKFNFSASVYENQGRFAQYFNNYAESIRPEGGDPAIIPGRGIAKRFKDDAYDYPVAEAYLSYTPSKFINVQFGHGKNFIGDGYRSLLQSDVASPYPYLKLNTKFWKIKYTNTYTWLKDVRPEVTEDGAFLTKYIANHYLSWNVNKRLNLGLFESVIWANTNNRGFDINYLNPIIFYRAIEFETGQDAGNAIVGASAKYKFTDNFNMYSQFVLDEFSLDDVTGGNKSWKNKFGLQLGAKYYNAFKIRDLILQAEYNAVRPYTYSHNTITLNYAHNNQPMAHLWGANFRELVLIGRYRKGRVFGEAKLIAGIRGFDVNNSADNFNYGGNIFESEVNRPFDSGVEIGQGIKTNTINASIQGGYLINPASNLKVFANVSYRNFNPEAETMSVLNNSTVWFNFGIRTDLFNWYFDL